MSSRILRGGSMFTAYLLLVNLPYGIITALAAREIIGKKPYFYCEAKEVSEKKVFDAMQPKAAELSA